MRNSINKKFSKIMEFLSIMLGLFIGTTYLDPMTVRSAKIEINSSLNHHNSFQLAPLFSSKSHIIEEKIEKNSIETIYKGKAPIIVALN